MITENSVVEMQNLVEIHDSQFIKSNPILTEAEYGLLILIWKKINLFCLIGLIMLVLLMWKWMGLLMRKDLLSRYWGCLSLLNWIGVLIFSLLLKLPSKKLELWFILWSFLLLKLLYSSVNLPYGLAWNIFVMSGLMLLAANWKC